MATRILGWAFVAVFAVELLSPIAVDSLRITGFVFLLSGIMVLVGSESAIRFTIFWTTLLILIFLEKLIPDIMVSRPLRINGQLRGYLDQEFWTLGFSAFMLLIGGLVLAIAALRSRKIRFWTMPLRIAFAFVGAILLFKVGLASWKWQGYRTLDRRMPAEVDASEKAFRAIGTSFMMDIRWHERLAAFPRIAKIECDSLSNYGTTLYDPYNQAYIPIYNPGGTVSLAPAGRQEECIRWIRDSAGDRCRLHIHLYVTGDSP
jgi:hypothetical protein